MVHVPTVVWEQSPEILPTSIITRKDNTTVRYGSSKQNMEHQFSRVAIYNLLKTDADDKKNNFDSLELLAIIIITSL